uniref:(northern house mosquito) hypothetical protein n=1 Tax=Culex pipiens TaxID=7175 RepID=A0A8D8BD95_CULPI
MLQPVRLAQVKLSPDFRLVLQQPQPLRRRNRRKLGQVLADNSKLLEDGLAAAAGGCGLDFAATAPGGRSAAVDARIAVVLVGTIRPDERHRRKVEILHFEPSSPEPKRNYETPRLLFLLAKKKGKEEPSPSCCSLRTNQNIGRSPTLPAEPKKKPVANEKLRLLVSFFATERRRLMVTHTRFMMITIFSI